MANQNISTEEKKKNIGYISKVLIGYTLGVCTVMGILSTTLTNTSNSKPQPSQTQAPHGLSLQRLIKENGGAMELVGTDKEEFRRKDRDGDRIYDLQQICSNGNAYFLSSLDVNSGKDECWYPIQKGSLFTMQEMERLAGEPAQ